MSGALRVLGGPRVAIKVGVFAAGIATLSYLALRRKPDRRGLGEYYQRRARRARRRDCGRIEQECAQELGLGRCERIVAPCWRNGR